ncbi:sigma-70 family RNA polymerase sigma factor [Algoriphagus sp. AGSA1]|uniref:RNA polymerase sigma factor n=1 Tax=Algoriphagus sp. AGSA1 TaxID=2907213 RepID=UPI001F2CB2F2|nr:sigma-70 family RNA polymerase sigma factor [Algoriphagus sp. AGSA1]MCE7058015.1 sigma-70 family RNA polymerase sigma factor [Algoriphagus sp. AGSA1]
MSFIDSSLLKVNSTEELWLELRSGEKAALEAIYRLFIKDLFRFGMSLHADEAIVQDAIQDVFIDLWNYRSKLCAEVNIRQYLFKSLSNRIQKELGKNAKRGMMVWVGDEIPLELSVEDQLVKRQNESEISSKLKVAMGNLPVRQKEVLQYLYFEKLSYEETSKLLDITIRSTYTLAWKAINALKKAIAVFLLFVVVSA